MDFKFIQDLHAAFLQGALESLPEEISITGIKYRLLKGTTYPLLDMIHNNQKGMVLYGIERNKENIEKYKKYHSNVEDSVIQERIALIWGVVKSKLQPVAAKFISAARSEPLLSSGVVREANISDNRIIGTHISIILSGFNNGEQLPAKVDTGAQICSLNATQIEEKRGHGMVSFVFGDKRYTMQALEVQAIQTADNGVENRPVVAFDVVVPAGDTETKNRIIKKVKFNLNDRSDMPDKILLGQNFIKAGDFVVVSDEEFQHQMGDQMGESESDIDWDSLQEEFKDIEYTSEETVPSEDLKALLDLASRLINKK